MDTWQWKEEGRGMEGAAEVEREGEDRAGAEENR